MRAVVGTSPKYCPGQKKVPWSIGSPAGGYLSVVELRLGSSDMHLSVIVDIKIGVYAHLSIEADKASEEG